MFEGELGLTSLDVPQFDSVVTGGTGKDTLGSGVEQDMANFPERVLAGFNMDSGVHVPHVPAQPSYGRNVSRLLAVALQGEVLWDLPDKDLRIVSLLRGAVKGAVGPTLPSSEADEINLSLNGLLQTCERPVPWPCRVRVRTSRCRERRPCVRERGASARGRGRSH